jgi:hypothetical protein
MQAPNGYNKPCVIMSCQTLEAKEDATIASDATISPTRQLYRHVLGNCWRTKRLIGDARYMTPCENVKILSDKEFLGANDTDHAARAD